MSVSVIAAATVAAVATTASAGAVLDSSSVVHQATGAVSRAVAAAPAAGAFAPLTPARALDTRIRLGAAGPVGPHGSIPLRVLGVAGVPAGNVAAVALTVTATRPQGSGYLTVYPDGVARPDASNLNFTTGQDVANMVIVPVGRGGNIRLFNGAGSNVDMIADVAGYFTGGVPAVAGSFRSLTSNRLLDTRFGPGAAAVPARGAASVRVTGVAGVPRTGVASVVVNLTATQSSAAGYLTVTANDAARPLTSSVNFAARQTVANLAVVPVGADGRVSVFNGSGGGVQVLVDVLGYYLSGTPSAPGAFRSVASRRVLDTRTGVGARGLLNRNAALPLRVAGSAGIPSSGVSAVVVNLTVTAPVSSGYLTAYPNNTARPRTSNLNFAARQTVAALVTVPVGSDGYVRIFNGGGATDVVVDVVGYYLSNASQACSSVSPDQSGTTVTRWNPVVQCVLAMLGQQQSAGNVSDVDIMIEYESSGNPDAVNLWDSNAQAGHPSKGLIQVIQPTFDAYRSPLLPDDLYDPAANLYAGLHYAISTYGSIHNIPGLVSLRNGGGYRGYIVRK